MQDTIIGFVARVQQCTKDRERLAAANGLGLSVDAVLHTLSKPALLRLREAALDLDRIVELEIGRRVAAELEQKH